MIESFWCCRSPGADTYGLFRGTFSLDREQQVTLRMIGAAWYQVWLDGKPLLEGPYRFALDHPEYQEESLSLSKGPHILAVHAHHIGEETRIIKSTPPFLWCQMHASGELIQVKWNCLPQTSQQSRVHRINPQLGWVEWRDTRQEPEGWQLIDYNDKDWKDVVCDASGLPEPKAADLAPVSTFKQDLVRIDEGVLATTFGYATDEPSYVFCSRDLECDRLPPKGIWRRYDLGRVRLGRPLLHMDLPEGTVVELAMSETLTDGRVSPYINLSAGSSCNLSHFVARGGEQTFCPLTPLGGRYLEVHIVNARKGVRFIKETFLERGYHAPVEHTFECNDPTLNRIWSIGVETYRACAEDALIDNPTRERGQWVGDVASVGLAIASVAYHDLRLCKRALRQAAQCPREDGLVAGMSPGGCVYLPTYAFQWSVAVLEYFKQTGDQSLLQELWPAAGRNAKAIRAFWNQEGLHNVAGWNFVDWGYVADDGPIDLACNLHYLWSLRAMHEWATVLKKDQDTYFEQTQMLEAILRKRLVKKIEEGWGALGYHCATLALKLKLFEGERECLDYLKQHLLECFPNNSDAPRNDDPLSTNPKLITPYFAHYVFPLLIEAGEMDFVLDQYRRCWGDYMLAEGRTTWIEVFDTRWSHCHQWSGCPTWQLSRYVLGLHPGNGQHPSHFNFLLAPGSLMHAKGSLPHPDGGWIHVSWEREKEKLNYRIETDNPIMLKLNEANSVEVNDIFAQKIKTNGNVSGETTLLLLESKSNLYSLTSLV